ncbi:PTS sugar transporter subunit IIA [Bacillus alveayuensis]|jgi:fructose-specific phosphotransferase system IIA component|uniref:PTS system fructose-specific IIC component n=1 Tax=Aeribacillus alveayuensis TaxID=279215 RepID=A0ABT9VPQ9_9BACI|nr:PTS system fructose-specific IIC component [Bacillus alveayuensis]
MNLSDLTSLELIDVHLKGTTKDEIIDELIEKLDSSGVLKSSRKFKKVILKREKEGSTGIGFSIAIPHGKSKFVLKPSVAFGLQKEGVDWDSVDGTPAKLIFMIAVPEESAGNEHLKILQMLSRKLMDETFREQLLAVQTNEEAYQLLNTIE